MRGLMRPKGVILFGLFVCFDGCQTENQVQFDVFDPQKKVKMKTRYSLIDLILSRKYAD